MNRSGSRHLLVVVPENTQELIDDRTRGIRVNIRGLLVSGQPPNLYVDIECSSPADHDLFDLLGSDLALALARAPIAPLEIVQQVVAKWRRFGSDLPRSLLSAEELSGLFGELWFLHAWLAPCVGHPKAVASWRGPLGARHDFASRTIGIEVKTTASQHGRLHRINGIDQLEVPENGTLLFFSVCIRHEKTASNSVPKLIFAIRANLANDAESATLFENALVRARYSDAFKDHYSEQRIQVVDTFLFEVTPNFPRITRGELVGAMLPPGVQSVEYDINLSGFAGQAICSRPEEATTSLNQLG